MLNEELIKILACPDCKKDVIIEKEKIICYHCKKYYPIENGIPVMLNEKAKKLENLSL